MGPAPQRATRNSDRSGYTLPGGLVLPSVTTILDATMPAEKAKALEFWRRRLILEHGEAGGKAEAERKRDEGAKRGTALHASVRRRLRGQPTFGGVWLKSIERILEQVTRALPIGDYGADDNPEIAIPVYDEILGYAGTPDLVAEIDAGRLLGEASRPCVAVIDWTSWDTAPARPGAKRRTYRAEYSHDKQVQAAAYAKAIPLSHGYDADAALAVIALPDKPALVYWVDVEAAFAEFRERLDRYQSKVAELGRFDEAPMPEVSP